MNEYDIWISRIEDNNEIIIIHICSRMKFNLSYSLIKELIRVCEYNGDDSRFNLSKEKLYEFETSGFNNDDWSFIRSVMAWGDDIDVEMWEHIYL